MIFAGAALLGLLAACAPSVASDTMGAIVDVESAGDELTLQDNTLRRSFHPLNRASATRLAEALIGRGDSVDVGIAQVNSANFPAYSVTPGQMLEPCRNLRVGSSILAADYRWSAARFSSPRLALWHAIAAYNSGSLYAGDGYVRMVVSEATMGPVVPSIALLSRERTMAPSWGSARSPAVVAARPSPRPTPTLEPGFGFSVPARR